MDDQQKLDVLRLVYSEEGENLRFETSTAQRLMTYFVTVELALGSWAAAAPIEDVLGRSSVFLLNIVFGICVARLIVLNYRRRTEVVTALRRALEGLKLATPEAFIPNRAVHEWKVNASWRNSYLGLILLFCSAQALPLFLLPFLAA